MKDLELIESRRNSAFFVLKCRGVYSNMKYGDVMLVIKGTAKNDLIKYKGIFFKLVY